MEYRHALITGASSGLGLSLSRWFARRGVRVFAAARRHDRLESLRVEFPLQIEPVTMDVADVKATRARISAIDTECGGLDLVIANAGISGETSGRSLDWNTVEQMIDINVTGAAATLTAALPAMVKRGRGHLVGISSVAAFRGLPRVAAYSASKAFLALFLESLRVDLKRTGVKVTCIYPGFVKSEMTAKNRFKMPFLMETEVAAEKMGKAILRGSASYIFPWQLAAISGPLKVFPDGLYDAAMSKKR